MEIHEKIQLDLYDHFVDTYGSELDEQAEYFADTYHSAYVNIHKTFQKKGKGKGKGKFKPRSSNLSIDDRKKKLLELKRKTQCRVCGRTGHWAGDKECHMRGEKTKAASYAANDAYEEDEDEGCQASVCMDGEVTEKWTEKIAQLAVIRLTPEDQTPESSKAHSPRLRTPPTTARTREGDVPSPERTVCHTIRAYDTWDDESHSGDDNTNVVRMMVKMPKPTKPASTGSQASSDDRTHLG